MLEVTSISRLDVTRGIAVNMIGHRLVKAKHMDLK